MNGLPLWLTCLTVSVASVGTTLAAVWLGFVTLGASDHAIEDRAFGAYARAVAADHGDEVRVAWSDCQTLQPNESERRSGVRLNILCSTKVTPSQTFSYLYPANATGGSDWFEMQTTPRLKVGEG